MRVLRPARSLRPEPASALLVLLRQIDIALPAKAKQHLRKWLAGAQSQAVGSELALSEALRVAMTEDVVQTIERAEFYARLRDRYVERNPAVMGGEPVITGTRVPAPGTRLRAVPCPSVGSRAAHETTTSTVAL
jgi:hypothetical protein